MRIIHERCVQDAATQKTSGEKTETVAVPRQPGPAEGIDRNNRNYAFIQIIINEHVWCTGGCDYKSLFVVINRTRIYMW